MKLTRDFYIPKDASKIFDEHGVVAFGYETNGVVNGVAFVGKAQRPAWNYRFRSAEARAEAIQKLVSKQNARATLNAKHKAERKQPVTLKVGDILTSSWGYEQTNREFWEVTKVNAATVEVRELGQETTESTGWCQGRSDPKQGNYIGESRRCAVHYGNQVRVHAHAFAHPWDGKPSFWSAYA